jgi:hypothetical protein
MQYLAAALAVFADCGLCFAGAAGDAVVFGPIGDFVPASRAKEGRSVFEVFVEESSKRPDIKRTAFVASSPDEFILLHSRLPADMRKKAIWLTVDELSSYSPREREMLRRLVTRCERAGISLSVHVRSNQAIQRTAK